MAVRESSPASWEGGVQVKGRMVERGGGSGGCWVGKVPRVDVLDTEVARKLRRIQSQKKRQPNDRHQPNSG